MRGFFAGREYAQTRWTQNSEITDFIWLLLVKRQSVFPEVKSSF
jgi:hypothetical protein